MTLQKGTILAFAQPGKSGEKILEEALCFKQILGVHVTVINVVKPLSLFEKKIQGQSQEKLISENKQELISFVKQHLGNEFIYDFNITVEAGNIDSVLIDKANSGKFELILIDKSMCNSQEIECKRKVDKIISESRCPVLTIGEETSITSIKNIAIPIDISQSTRKRLRWAQFFAKKFNAKVTILSALNANIQVKNSLAYKNANKIKHLLWEHNIDCDVQVFPVKGRKKEDIILEYIEKERPGLVIIRTHQESITSFSNIRTFVSEIIHGSKIPVLSVNYTPNPASSLFL